MRKIIAATTLALALVLTGCSSDSNEPTPRETVTVQATPEQTVAPRQPQQAPQTNASAEDEFVRDIQENGMTAALGPVPQQDVINLGYKVCEGYDSGLGFENVVNIIVEAGVTPTDSILIAASAADNLCPEHSADIAREIEQLGASQGA